MTTQGLRLKKIRQTLNLSQEALGEKLCVSKQYISNLEADRNILNNEKLVLLLFDFDVNLNWLIGGKGEMFNKKTSDFQSEDEFEMKVEEVLKRKGII